MTKKYFIGIDSDGTAFDSMTIKHKKAFIPEMIKVWNLHEHAAKVAEICEYINLYSSTRGIDRFSGLKVTFDRFEASGIPVPDYRDLDGYLAVGKLSNATLENYLKTHESAFLTQVLAWSHQADEVFQREVETLPPFPGVKPALRKAFPLADIAVISSASEKSLSADWRKEDLISCTTKVYGQEFGTKKAQLAAAVTGKYAPNCTMMIGDAVGDWRAAQSVGAYFYPMIPGKEQQSWELLTGKYLDIYLSGSFNDDIQQKLLDDFNKVVGD